MKKLTVFLMLVTLCGCFGGFSQPSRFYSLRPSDPAAKTYKSKQMFVGIEPVKVPVYLDKPQIVTRDANQVELNISEVNRWAEPLSDAVQNLLATDIGMLLPKAAVKPSSYRREGFDYVVWVEIGKFEGTWNQKVVLDAWWSIFDRNNNLITRDKINLECPLGDNYDELVKQQSTLIGELAKQIAARLARLPG